MICNNCEIRDICNINSDMKKYVTYAKINISSCNFYKSTLVKAPVNQANIDPFTGKKKVDRDKITELSNLNRKIKEESAAKEAKAKPKLKVESAKPLKLDHICEGCGASTFKEDKSKCDKCGKAVCSCCATLDGDSKNLLCPECWINL